MPQPIMIKQINYTLHLFIIKKIYIYMVKIAKIII